MANRCLPATSQNASRVLRQLLENSELEGGEVLFMGRSGKDFYFLVEVFMEEDDFFSNEYTDDDLRAHVQRVLNLCQEKVTLTCQGINNFDNSEGITIAFADVVMST